VVERSSTVGAGRSKIVIENGQHIIKQSNNSDKMAQ
jgi:hypothetical protein